MTSHWLLHWRRPLSLIKTTFMKKWDIAKYVRAGHQEFWRECTKADVSRMPIHIFNDLEKKKRAPAIHGTDHETLEHHFAPLTKQAVMLQKHPTSPRSRTFKCVRRVEKLWHMYCGLQKSGHRAHQSTRTPAATRCNDYKRILAGANPVVCRQV